MPRITKTIRMDISEPYWTKVSAKQHDDRSRSLAFELMDGDQPLALQDAASAALYVRKPDSTRALLSAEITDREQGRIAVTLTAQSLAAAGVARCELMLYGEDHSLLSTFPFEMVIIGAVHDDEAVISSNEYSALTAAIVESKAMIDLMRQTGGGSMDDYYTKQESGALIDDHNASETAHPDIRDSVESKISGHSTDATAHPDIRDSVESKISGHNADAAAHQSIREALAEKAAFVSSNLWEPKGVTFPLSIGGVTLDYDPATEIYTLNGIAGTGFSITLYAKMPLTVSAGQVYSISRYYMGGTITSSGSNALNCYVSLGTAQDALVGTCGASSTIQNYKNAAAGTYTPGEPEAANIKLANYRLWVYQDTTYTNYKFKIQFEKGPLTPWRPCMSLIKVFQNHEARLAALESRI